MQCFSTTSQKINGPFSAKKPQGSNEIKNIKIRKKERKKERKKQTKKQINEFCYFEKVFFTVSKSFLGWKISISWNFSIVLAAANKQSSQDAKFSQTLKTAWNLEKAIC